MQRLHDAPERRQELAAVIELADKIAVDLRRVSHGLHPSSLDLLGLGPAIRQLCIDFSDRQSTAVTCEVQHVPRDLDRGVAICLYRVAQECLRNVLKHSHAAHARVQLSCAGGADPTADRRRWHRVRSRGGTADRRARPRQHGGAAAARRRRGSSPSPSLPATERRWMRSFPGRRGHGPPRRVDYFPPGLQLSNLNAPTCVAQLKLPDEM